MHKQERIKKIISNEIVEKEVFHMENAMIEMAFELVSFLGNRGISLNVCELKV